jgi:hypothetical protein
MRRADDAPRSWEYRPLEAKNAAEMQRSFLPKTPNIG